MPIDSGPYAGRARAGGHGRYRGFDLSGSGTLYVVHQGGTALRDLDGVELYRDENGVYYAYPGGPALTVDWYVSDGDDVGNERSTLPDGQYVGAQHWVGTVTRGSGGEVPADGRLTGYVWSGAGERFEVSVDSNDTYAYAAAFSSSDAYIGNDFVWWSTDRPAVGFYIFTGRARLQSTDGSGLLGRSDTTASYTADGDTQWVHVQADTTTGASLRMIDTDGTDIETVTLTPAEVLGVAQTYSIGSDPAGADYFPGRLHHVWAYDGALMSDAQVNAAITAYNLDDDPVANAPTSAVVLQGLTSGVVDPDDATRLVIADDLSGTLPKALTSVTPAGLTETTFADGDAVAIMGADARTSVAMVVEIDNHSGGTGPRYAIAYDGSGEGIRLRTAYFGNYPDATVTLDVGSKTITSNTAVNLSLRTLMLYWIDGDTEQVTISIWQNGTRILTNTEPWTAGRVPDLGNGIESVMGDADFLAAGGRVVRVGRYSSPPSDAELAAQSAAGGGPGTRWASGPLEAAWANVAL